MAPKQQKGKAPKVVTNPEELKQLAQKALETVQSPEMWTYKPPQRIGEILDIQEGEGELPKDITVCGWVRSIRDQSGVKFLTISDGCSTELQCVVGEACKEEDREALADARMASVELTGDITESIGGGQTFDLTVKSGRVVGSTDQTYPLHSKGRLELETLRNHLHLRIRTRSMAAVARVRHALAFSVHKFFEERDYKYIHTPCLTSNDCEGAGECFRVTSLLKDETIEKVGDLKKYLQTPKNDYFQKPTMLTVSGQLHVETYAAALGRVYTFGPTFRAEKSDTTRHLAEFWMIEPEVYFANLDDIMNLAEDFVRYLLSAVLRDNLDDLILLQEYHTHTWNTLSEQQRQKSRMQPPQLVERLANIAGTKFTRITYSEAVDLCNENIDKIPEAKGQKVEWGDDLNSCHERYLAEEIFKGPVMVHHYPQKIKSFYMTQDRDAEEGKQTVEAVDCLVPGIGELIGGSTREPDLERLQAACDMNGIDQKGLDWYLDMRRFGTAPHGGFGLGFERMVQLATGMANIRDVIPFPRWWKHATY